jgi:hypothetical protein
MIPKHKWAFRSRFRANAFGWRSDLPIKRIREALSEIRKVKRKDAVLAADGAVLLLEKLSPSLMQVDSSSGAIGTAVNNAIATLVPIIAHAPAEDTIRDHWLERLWQAVEDDRMPYIELLTGYWGELCVTEKRASEWADRFVPTVQHVWTDNNPLAYFKGCDACLSCLLHAGHYQELLDLAEMAPQMWHYRQWGVKALAAMGKRAEALRYAEASYDLNTNPSAIAAACESILIESGMADEAYRRYAIVANQRNTYLATYRAIAKKYPHKEAQDILTDLVDSTPGEEGKWFATAKSMKLFDEAIDLANRSPCNPQTLVRAARDTQESHPAFAMKAGVIALRWMLAGYGYELTGADVLDAFRHMFNAAERIGQKDQAIQALHELIAAPGADDWVVNILETALQRQEM